MEFRLDEEQVELQQTVARLFEARFPLDDIQQREGAALDGKNWANLADLGIFGLLVDPAAGGSGLGAVEAALVFEQVGSHLVPGPLLWSVLVGASVDGVLEGKTVVAGVEVEDSSPDGHVIESLTDAEALVALRDDTVTVHRVDALRDIEPLAPLDPQATVARVASLNAGETIGGQAEADRMRMVGTVLTAAELVGVASRSLEVARTYALERNQFDVPIGSFQAVKHMLADQYVQVTLAQSATYAAAAVVDHPGVIDDPVASVAAAKLLAVEAAIEGASTAIQVLGGMGFTWDMLPNHLLKRAWHLSHRFGSADHLAERLGAQLVGATR